MPQPEPLQAPGSLSITARCLLRLMTALELESQGLILLHPAASAELNARTGRCFSARQWTAILRPAYCSRFLPDDPSISRIGPASEPRSSQPVLSSISHLN